LELPHRKIIILSHAAFTDMAGHSNSAKDSFPLNLDSSVSVPVILRDVNPSSSFESPPLESIISNASKSPPGKFYKPESGAVLLNTLKTGGPSARLMLTETADSIAIQHFDRFQRRLQAGDIVNSFCLSPQIFY
jgi:hypothetical protein